MNETRRLVASGPSAVAPLRAMRSTLLWSSLQSVRARGLGERYFELLDKSAHAEVRSVVAGVWIDIPVAVAHYRALDRLLPAREDQIEMGRAVADKVHRSLLSTVARLATAAGVTPWAALSRATDLWQRLFEGGAVKVEQLSATDATLEIVAPPLVNIAYFRTAMGGLVAGSCELFCRKCHVKNETTRTPGASSMRVSWA